MDTASSTPSVDTSSVSVPTSSSDMSTASAGAAIPQTVVNSTKDSASKGSWGGLIGIILIVLLIIMAAFYSWGERLETQTPPEADTETVE